jgi:hypothetical protein
MKHTKKAEELPQQDEIGPEMRGADVMDAALEREGVDVVYAYPGGASLELHQALTKASRSAPSFPALNKAAVSWRTAMPALLESPLFAWRLAARVRPISLPVLPTPSWTAFP